MAASKKASAKKDNGNKQETQPPPRTIEDVKRELVASTSLGDRVALLHEQLTLERVELNRRAQEDVETREKMIADAQKAVANEIADELSARVKSSITNRYGLDIDAGAKVFHYSNAQMTCSAALDKKPVGDNYTINDDCIEKLVKSVLQKFTETKRFITVRVMREELEDVLNELDAIAGQFSIVRIDDRPEAARVDVMLDGATFAMSFHPFFGPMIDKRMWIKSSRRY